MANSQNISFTHSPLVNNHLSIDSPMTDLAKNLSTTNLHTARRKLSLSSNGESPDILGSPMAVSPMKSPDRLLKTNLRFSGSGTPVGSGATRKAGLVRRLGHLGDENYNPMQSSPVVSPSKFLAVRQVSSNNRVRQPLEDCDPNSQDSGFCFSDDSKSTSLSSDFPFAQPSGLAPRRNTTDSPRRGPHSSSSSSGADSVDDGFSDFVLPLQDEEAQLPPGIGGLIKDPIINLGITSDSPHFFNFKDVISENISPMSPVFEDQPKSKKRSSTALGEVTPVSKKLKLLTETNTLTEGVAITPRRSQHTLFAYGFKRLAEPRPPLNHSISLEEPAYTPPPKPKFRHCLSESEAVIKRALHRSYQEELIGDFSRAFALPLTVGSHQDLKSISPLTLAALINGEFADRIASYQIVDCRYPYEYEGGHIRGAVNIYTRDQLMKEFLESRPTPPASSSPDDKRNIIVFHCEFSSERGPGLSRFLRSKDRENNAYPALHYPEVYLLEGGYKAFFQAQPELCEPCAYRKMVDADKEQLQHFRAKSKTWSGDKSNRVLKRSTSFKRLGL